MANRITAVCAFNDRTLAENAVNDLKAAGFREGQIGVVTQKHDDDLGSKAVAGAAIGAAAGAGAGTLWALGIAASVFPPIGVVAGGTVMAVLASAAAGAAVSGVAGALIGLGLTEVEADFYDQEFRSGRTLVTVKSPERYDDAVNILRDAGGYDMSKNGPVPARAVYDSVGM